MSKKITKLIKAFQKGLRFLRTSSGTRTEPTSRSVGSDLSHVTIGAGRTKISVRLIPKKKGLFSALKSPYSLVFHDANRTVEYGISEDELPAAGAIEAMFPAH